MFWRFGFHGTSPIEALLDQDDLVVDDLLREDDVLQECKAQNTRLVEFLQRSGSLQRLFELASAENKESKDADSKLASTAAEVLCSDLAPVIDSCVNDSQELLSRFWLSVLSRDPEYLRSRVGLTVRFAKINTNLLNKKPQEMFELIQGLPSIVDKLLSHIESSPIVDLVMRIIQLHEVQESRSVLIWLSSQGFIPRLVECLSPDKPLAVHSVAAELIKSIITMSSPSPGQPALSEGLQNGPASNRFARELASPKCIQQLTSYMLQNVTHPVLYQDVNSPRQSGNRAEYRNWIEMEAAASSVSSSISVVIELIRKNNSDYFEPFLFHSIRNRLIQVQQDSQYTNSDGNARVLLEQSMSELTDKMGVVHFGALLELMSAKLEDFRVLLKASGPRGTTRMVQTSVGDFMPLTFERLRVCELVAELLHCSNMSLLNRTGDIGPSYDATGKLRGGLSALEELAQVVSVGNTGGYASPGSHAEESEIEPAKELPIAAVNPTPSPSLKSDDSFSDDDGNEAFDLESHDPSTGGGDAVVIGTNNEQSREGSLDREPLSSDGVDSRVQTSLSAYPTDEQQRIQKSPPNASAGERFKFSLLNENIVASILDLFFDFPWNNILHTVVYDLLHQILTGRTEGRANRELILSLFRNCRLPHRILDAQEMNSKQTMAVKRLGYMGHITLIADDIMTALDQYPAELQSQLKKYIPQPVWDQYIKGAFSEAKRKDSTLLGGGRPVRFAATPNPFISSQQTLSQSDEVEYDGSSRHTRQGLVESASDMAVGQDSSNNSGQFTQYLASAISHNQFASTDDISDEEEEDSGWLSRSHFDLTAGVSSVTDNTISGQNANFTQPSGFDRSRESVAPVHKRQIFQGQSQNDLPSTAEQSVGDDPEFDDFGDFQDFSNAGGWDDYGFNDEAG